MEHEQLTQTIIGCAYRVYNTMGAGFYEAVYQRCMLVELRKAGIAFEEKVALDLTYEGEPVGIYEADLIIEGVLILELKAVRQLALAHEIQLVNYLAATGIELGLLINFGESKVEVKRKYRTKPIV